ncbi:hypothetical protein [Shinella sp.]|uniref:hypothetical protein n=2 Tax=Shinella sp. TaxID=1870904 RepID=UPI004035E01F
MDIVIARAQQPMVTFSLQRLIGGLVPRRLARGFVGTGVISGFCRHSISLTFASIWVRAAACPSMREPASQSLSHAARMALTSNNADAMFFMQSVLLHKEHSGNVRMSGLLSEPDLPDRACTPRGAAAIENRRSRAASAEGVARHNSEVHFQDYIYIIHKNFSRGSEGFQAAFGISDAQNFPNRRQKGLKYPILYRVFGRAPRWGMWALEKK